MPLSRLSMPITLQTAMPTYLQDWNVFGREDLSFASRPRPILPIESTATWGSVKP